MKKLYSAFIIVLAFSVQAFAQNSLTTVPPLNGGNGQAGVSFNVSATGTNLIVDSIHAALYAGPTTQQVEIWYNTTAINGAPTITTANGWVLAATATVNNVTNGTTSPAVLYSLPANLGIMIPAGQTFGFYIGSASTASSSVAYSNGGGTNPNSVTDGTMTITMDATSAFGGPTPNPTFNPRQFNGTIYYTLPSAAPWDAGISNLSAASPCDTLTPISATITNYGDSIITSLTVNWTLNGAAQTPYSFSGTLDTLGGTGSSFANITLGTVVTTGSPVYNVMAWVSGPNGNADTINYNDTAYHSFSKGLAGTYTIGGPGADYYSYGAAVTDMNTVGVCGPVLFLVNDSTYNEQVALSNIAGAGSINTITFESASGDSSQSILTYGSALSATNYTLLIDAVDYVTFRGITIENTSGTYRHAVELNSATHATFENCVFSNSPTSTSNNYALFYANSGHSNYLTLRNNRFDGGSYGIYFYGTSTTSRALKPVITGNEFYTYYQGMRLYYVDSAQITNNLVSTGTTASSTWYGIYNYYGSNLNITGNRVIDTITSGGYGLYLGYAEGTAANKSLIANNSISMGTSGTTGSLTGIYMTNCGNLRIAHNSVRMETSSTSAEALYTSGGGANILVNNNLTVFGAGYPAYFQTGFDFSESNYNNLYSTSGNIGYYQSNIQSLSAWQSATGHEMNSVSADPMYYGTADLHACSDSINNVGKPVEQVTVDMDGDSRSTTMPDIGSDEFIGTKPYLGPDTSYCVGTSGVMLGWATASGTSFLWSTGDMTSSIMAAATGTYYVTTTNACGVSSDTIDVVSKPQANASFTQATSYLTVTFTNTSTNANSYLWNFGDGSISTQMNPQHLYSTSGPKIVKLFATNDCGTDTFIMNINLQIVGVKEQSGPSISVYPNPGNGFITLQLEGAEAGENNIVVTNLQGQTVYTGSNLLTDNRGIANLDLNHLSKGVYLLSLQNGKGTSTVRVVIQ